MSLSAEFKQALSRYNIQIDHDNALTIKEKRHEGETWTTYDFFKRCMTVTYREAKREYYSGLSIALTSSISVMPFDSVDRDTLENMRQYLIDNDKKPLPLPEKKQDPNSWAPGLK